MHDRVFLHFRLKKQEAQESATGGTAALIKEDAQVHTSHADKSRKLKYTSSRSFQFFK